LPYFPDIANLPAFDNLPVIVTTRQFRQFLVLAEVRNFRRAAADLKISQPALTKSVLALEKELGVRLLDRQPRGVTLTEFGERVVTYGKALVDNEKDLRHDLALIAGLETGRVNVALGPYPSVVSGYAAAARLGRERPKLAIGLRVGSWRAITQAVAERQVDLGIAELTDAHDNQALATERVGAHLARYFCSPSHPIMRRERNSFADLLKYPWATTRIPPRVAAAFPESLGRAGWIDPATGDFVPAIELDVPMQLAAFAAGGDALAIGGHALVERELRAGTLAVVPTAQLHFRAEYGFIWLRHRSLSPAVLAYMQAVREEERMFVEREARLAAVYRHPRRGRPRS
jgi:DNA-binding transcriptional LysR family regulator